MVYKCYISTRYKEVRYVFFCKKLNDEFDFFVAYFNLSILISDIFNLTMENLAVKYKSDSAK